MTDGEIIDSIETRRFELSDLAYDPEANDWMWWTGYDGHGPDAAAWAHAPTFREAVKALVKHLESA